METIVAPISKYKKTNLKIAIFGALVATVIFGYDGYLSKYEWSMRTSFYEEHVKDGVPDDDMQFNQKAPVLLVVVSFLVAFRLFVVKDRKVTADEESITVNGKEKIPYSSIKKVDKTWYQAKGYFDIEYDTGEGQTSSRISRKNYDNLDAVIEKLTAKLS
ncbi:MAG: hypothetical protein PHF37_10470 [Phycisphaerae bacterium]|nr:hypothetical protein [Phycisphaerae bacterium]